MEPSSFNVLSSANDYEFEEITPQESSENRIRACFSTVLNKKILSEALSFGSGVGIGLGIDAAIHSSHEGTSISVPLQIIFFGAVLYFVSLNMRYFSQT